MKIKILLPGNYLQCNIVCIWNQISYHSFILRDYISLQATCQIFVDRPAPLRQPISHSQWSVIHSHLIYPTHNASLLSMIFTSLRLLYIIMSYDHSNFVTELNEFDRWKSEKVETWISRSVGWESNYVPWELFTTHHCLYLKSNILSFFHIEGLHISVSTLSDFCQSAHAASTTDFSFPYRSHPSVPYISDTDSFTGVIDSQICLLSLYYHELWSF
jgi:hypothetical protein